MTQQKAAFEVDLDRDVHVIELMAANLTPYIYESELYGVMPGDYPRLTVGGLLMRLHRLSALNKQLSLKQQITMNEAQHLLEEVRRKWAVAYEGKIQQEIKARMINLAQCLTECEENPASCVENFPSAIEKRVMVEVLKDEAETRSVWTDELKGLLTSIDKRIHRCAVKDEFCWDPRVQPAYPPEKFWFLYVHPKK
jgi:hypothetical protein